jgi:hypothetical protein
VLTSVEWIFPAYLRLGVLQELAEEIEAAAPADKHGVLAGRLPSLYSADDLAVMLLERYRKLPHVSDFGRQIGEAIEAAHLGLFCAAVTTLLPALEGVMRKMATARSQPAGQGTAWLVGEIETLIEATRNAAAVYPQSREALDERVMMLEVFRDFWRSKLLANTGSYVGTGSLNRHGILHGVFDDFGYEWNFYKLVSLLDMLCFFIALSTPGVSALAPVQTPASVQLAAYYESIAALGPLAHRCGARV